MEKNAPVLVEKEREISWVCFEMSSFVGRKPTLLAYIPDRLWFIQYFASSLFYSSVSAHDLLADGFRIIYDREVPFELRVQESADGPQQVGTLEAIKVKVLMLVSPTEFIVTVITSKYFDR